MDETPAGPAPGAQAQEFNLWCAMNDRPFALRPAEWPEEGPHEWFIEADRGRPDAAVIWGTGTTDETVATQIAYAFVAGIEWAETERSLDRDETGLGEERAGLAEEGRLWGATAALAGAPGLVGGPGGARGSARGAEAARQTSTDSGPDVEWIDTDEFDDLPHPLRVGAPPLAAKIDGAEVRGRTALADAVEDIAADFARLPAPAASDRPGPAAATTKPATTGAGTGDPDQGESLPPDDRPAWSSEEGAGPQGAKGRGEDGGDPQPDQVRTEPASAAADPDDFPYSDEEEDEEESESAYARPPIRLLAGPVVPEPVEDSDENELAERAAKLETVLRNFRVRGEIMEVRPGPCVTLFELEPVPGTKSSTIINLADDIARSMSAVTCRIALVPGRSVIGIELPNDERDTVYLQEILASDAFQASPARLPLALGKDIGGEPVVVDLARMPHLLIAGTTGSGKSVGINAMILSLLYRMSPDQVRFIMIDPKMLELSVYDDIPHLLTPVVTDPHKAVTALRWVVREMESRYRAMALLGVRNLDGYNARVRDLNERGEQVTSRVQVGFDKERREPVFEDRIVRLDPLPCIVVVVDEMADLMLVAGKEIETLIQRLAQMARAAGIHLIMATQRPSVDVITGTIKANFPTRISFQVTSKIDSRTILGESGAEQLLGQGDMLFMRAGGRISRVHGAFVSDREVETVVAHLQRQGVPEYVYSVTEEDDSEGGDGPLSGGGGVGSLGSALEDRFSDDGEDGDLYSQALAVILREGKVSVSFVQRHLQIGYNRAARLVERMEHEGVISAPNHVGKRDILVSARQYFAGSDDP